MKPKRAYNIIPYSTSKESRINKVLFPESIVIDGKKLEDHLFFVSQYAKYIQYYNLDNKKTENWQPFFSKNDVIFLSNLLQTDVSALTEKKNRIYNQSHQKLSVQNKERTIQEFQLFFIELIKILTGWYIHAKEVEGTFIAYELKNAIKNRLSQEANNVISTDKTIFNPPEIQEKFFEIYKEWQPEATDSNVSLEITKGTYKLINDPEKIHEACNAFLVSIQYILQQVPQWLSRALEKEQTHTAHIGLLLSFLKLQTYIKEQLNGLSQKHLDYYYRTLLQQNQQAAKPDRCIVFFQLAKEALSCHLQEGMRLSAGQTKEGIERIYRTIDEEELFRTKLTQIRTLLISTNPIIAPLNKVNLVTGIYTFQKTITDKELLNQAPYKFHLFGADSFGNTDVDQESIFQPQVGCAIAAPVFFMKEGERSVSIAMSFGKKSMGTLWGSIKSMAAGSEFTEMEMLYYFFSDSFQLSITGKEGWITIENYAIDFKKKDTSLEYPNEIVFLFTFGKDIPEIIAIDPTIHKASYQTSFPVLQMVLKSNTTYYPYSLLRDVTIDEIVIQVDCSGIKDLQLHDAFGKLENNKPFEPFGPAPLKGENFYVGYEELIQKKLTALSFYVDWYKLPQEGFEAYYSAYPGNITNSSFTFNLYALSQGEWIPPKREHSQNIPLFQEENGALIENSMYQADVGKLYYVPEFTKRDLPFSFDNAVTGFFKLELDSPPIGFGQDAYLKIMANNVVINLNAPNRRRRPNLVIPETPFVPKMNTLRMQYSAEQVIHFNSSKEDRKAKLFPFEFFHIQPFGTLKVADLKRIKKSTPVPKFNNRGYLYLGFKEATPNETLSLYFHINTFSYNVQQAEDDMVWEYLQGASWKTLPKENILEDQTTGFTESGIVKLHIPERINHHHPLFSEAPFWLRLSSSQALELIRECSYINTQAVVVEQDTSLITPSQDPLPELSITAVYDKNKDVKSIFQPFPSYAGEAPESASVFYTRLSERLFHKNRAVTTTDYEQLILEQFSEVFQVSCLTSTLFPEEIQPNEVIIMLLRNMDMSNPVSRRKFSVTTLEKVKNYISQLAPPYVKITVRNPIYEVIRVSCDVTLKDNRLSGEKLKNIQQTINAHIAPWLFHRDPSTYKKHIIHAKGIENVIARQPYVDFVTNFSLVQFHHEDGIYNYKDTAARSGISPSQPWSVFVPATSHDIRLVNGHITKPPTPLQISVMKIEEDFILQPDEKPIESAPPPTVEKPGNRRRIVLKVRF